MSDVPDPQSLDNEMLRYKRLIFYSEEVNQINEHLTDFLDNTQSKAGLIVDVEGDPILPQFGQAAVIPHNGLIAIFALYGSNNLVPVVDSESCPVRPQFFHLATSPHHGVAIREALAAHHLARVVDAEGGTIGPQLNHPAVFR